MTTTYLGSVTLGGALPGGAAVAVAGAAGINSTLPDLLARLESLLAWTPTPIDLSVQVQTLNAMITALQLQITLGVPPPSLGLQLVQLAELIAGLQSLIAGVEAQLAIVTAFQAALGAAGVHLVAYEGPVGGFGSEVSGALASVPGLGPLDACNALSLLTTVPATWAALGSILKTTP